MAGRANGRGSKSSSTSKSVRDRIKDAREMGLSGIKSKKKDTATSGTKKNYGSAKPRRVGQGGKNTITESVDNLIGGAFTKENRRGARRISAQEKQELIAKRREAQGERTQGRRARTPEQEALIEARRKRVEKSGVLGKGGRRSAEEGDGTGRRARPGGPGIKNRGPKRPGRGVTDTTPADRGRGPRPGGNVGPEGRGPKAGRGQGGKGRGPGAGVGQGRKGGAGPKRGNRGARPGMGADRGMTTIAPEMFFM